MNAFTQKPDLTKFRREVKQSHHASSTMSKHINSKASPQQRLLTAPVSERIRRQDEMR